MSKDPTFPFYSQDFLVGTFGMEDAAVGRYIRLLALQHQTGHLTEKAVLKICGGENDLEVMQKFVQDADGLFFNERLDEVLNTRERFKAKQKDNIEKRWSQNNTKDIPETYQKHTKSIPLENEIEKEKEIEIDKENKINKEAENFEKFRKAYPGTKRGFLVELADFKKKHPDWKEIVPILQDQLNYQIDQRTKREQAGNFIPQWKNLKTWLYQRSWEEEINVETNGSQGPAKQLSAAEKIIKSYQDGKL